MGSKKKGPLAMIWFMVYSVVLFGFCSCSAHTSDVPADKTRAETYKTRAEIDAGMPELEETISNELSANQMIYFAIALVDGKEVFFEQVIGAAEEYALQAGSNSKSLSAFGALELVQEGAMELDAPLKNYVNTPYLDNPVAAEEITLRMCLNHTSGIADDPTGTNRTVVFPPGKSFHYSGGGFAYFQQAAEDTTGIPYAQYMQEAVLSPLAMNGSTFVWDWLGNVIVLAAASLHSPATELALFFAELIDPSPKNEFVVGQMIKPSVSVTGNLSSGLDWGLGVGIYQDLGPVYWHWGSNFGFYHSLVVVVPSTNIGIAVMAGGCESLDPLRTIVQSAIGGPDRLYWMEVPTN